MNAETCNRRRWYLAWPQRTCTLAAITGIALLTAACGSSPSSSTASGGAPHTGSPADRHQAFAFAQCMRTHGVAKYPDPGSGPVDSSQLGVSDSQYESAKAACQSEAPASGQQHPGLTSAQQQHVLSQLLSFSRCMRSHGLPNFPDPNSATTIFVQNGQLFNMPSNINVNSSQFTNAADACKALMPSELNGSKGNNGNS